MKYRLFLPLLLCGAVLLALSACSDPAGVGANLGADSLEQGTPQSHVLAPTLLDTVSVPSETGFDSRIATRQRSWRFLVGAVQDPIAGTIRAEGYVDFLGTAVRSVSIRQAPLDSLNAELRLEPTYLHGDTSSTLEVRLSTLESEADMHRATADTSFTTGRDLENPETGGVTHSITPTDSLVTLPLPTSWIETHIDTLREGTNFGAEINGFKIVAENEPSSTDRRLVTGFDLANTTLRLRADSTETTEADTVDFSALKSFTHIERDRSPEASLDGWTLLQDGMGINLRMNWNFEEPPLDSLKNMPLNQADITVPIDQEKMQAVTSANVSDRFARPSVNNYRMLATSDSAECRQIGLPALQNEESTCILPTLPRFAPDVVRVPSETAFTLFERALLETSPFSSFQVEIAPQEDPSRQNALRRGLPSTLPVLVRTDSTSNGEGGNFPQATIIVTPL